MQFVRCDVGASFDGSAVRYLLPLCIKAITNDTPLPSEQLPAAAFRIRGTASGDAYNGYNDTYIPFARSQHGRQ
eukprot:gene10685-biopygen1382